MKSTRERVKRCSRKSVAIQLLAMGMCLLGTGQNASAVNYFQWDGESNTIHKRNRDGSTATYTVQYYGTSSRDCTVAHAGSCSIKLAVVGNDSGNQSLGADTIDWGYYPFNVVGGPALYYRWWMKIMPGFSWGNGTHKTKSSRVIGTPAGRVYTGYVEKDGFYIAECETVSGYPGGGCLDANGVPNNDYRILVPFDMTRMADGQWHEYVVMVKPNTTTTSMDAQLRAWVDGVQVGQYLNWRLHDVGNNQMIEGWGGWMVTAYFQLNGTASDGGTIYVDDFSVDDTYNSLISGTSPTAPSGLTVR